MRSYYPPRMRYVVLIVIALAACGTPVLPSESGPVSQPPNLERPGNPDVPSEAPAPDADMVNRRVEEFDAYVPPRLIGPDGIRPIYEPRFVAATDAPLEDDELVIGVSLEGAGKAYPISVLRFREMVNDELGELPILVTW